MRPSVGGVGVRAKHGDKQKVVGSAAVVRVAGIASGCVNGRKWKASRFRSPRRRSARASAQRRIRKHLAAAARVATSCLFSCGARRNSDSVRAYAVRHCGASTSVRRGGADDASGSRRVIADAHLDARKYVVASGRSLGCGPKVLPLPQLRWPFFTNGWWQDCKSRRPT